MLSGRGCVSSSGEWGVGSGEWGVATSDRVSFATQRDCCNQAKNGEEQP